MADCFSTNGYTKLNINPIVFKVEGVLGENLADIQFGAKFHTGRDLRLQSSPGTQNILEAVILITC